MCRLPVLIILASLTFLGLDNTFAQSYSSNTWLEPWFLEARFALTDDNKDGFLDREELGFYPVEWGFFLINEYYLESDLNGDDQLSEQEILRRVGTAHNFRLKEDGGQIKRLRDEYPYFDQAKPVYFKRHPALAVKLFENLEWVRSHPDIVQKLILNESWLKQNPELVRALQRNLTALAEYPTLANQLYSYKTTQRLSPEAQSWRLSHQGQLEAHKQDQNRVMRIALLDEKIPDAELRNAKLAQSSGYRPVLQTELPDGIQAEAAALENELIRLIERLQVENQTLKSAEDQLRRQVQELRSALDKLSSQASPADLNHLKRKIAELSTSKAQLETQLDQLSLAQRDENIKIASVEVQQMRAELIQLQEENEQYHQLLNGNQDSLRIANIMQETQILQLQQVIVSMGAELDQRPSQLAGDPGVSHAEVTRYKSEITSLRQKLEGADSRTEGLQESLTRMSSSLQQAELTNRRLRDTLAVLEYRYENQIDQLVTTLEGRQQEASPTPELVAQNKALTQQLATLNAKINTLETQLAEKPPLQIVEKVVQDEAAIKALEQKYLARLQRQYKQTDSIMQLNRDLAAQVDDLQMAMVEGTATEVEDTPTKPQGASDMEEAFQALENRYRAQIEELQAQLASSSQIDPNTINQLQQAFSTKLNQQIQFNQHLTEKYDSLALASQQQSQQLQSFLAEGGRQNKRDAEVEQQLTAHISTLEKSLEAEQAKSVAAQEESRSLKELLEQKSNEEAQLQKRTMETLASERERQRRRFSYLQDSLQLVIHQQAEQITQLKATQELMALKTQSAVNDAAAAVTNPIGDEILARNAYLQMELKLANEVEDSLLAIGLRQSDYIAHLEGQRDTLVQELRLRDRSIESYMTRLKLQRDSLDQLLALQNEAYSSISTAKDNRERQIDQLKQQVAALEYDNEKMMARVDAGIAREDALKVEMSKLQSHNEALLAKNENLKARRNNKTNVVASTLQDELERLEKDKSELLIEKESLKNQLASLESFIAQIRQSETRLKRDLQQQKAANAQLFSRVDSLEGTIQTFQAYNWPDSVDYYRQQLFIAQGGLENQRGMNIAVNQNHSRQVDSLQRAMLKLRQEILAIEQGNTFDVQRLHRVEQREQQLDSRQQNLEKQEGLIRQQSKMIEGRLESLSDLEKRYLDLLEREKRLQLIEQQLKQQPGYKEAVKSVKGK